MSSANSFVIKTEITAILIDTSTLPIAQAAQKGSLLPDPFAGCF